MVSFTKQGVAFSYHGDEILFRWPWTSGDRFHSSLHATDFNHFRDYWITVGSRMEKDFELRKTETSLVGQDAHEVLGVYARVRYPGENVIILTSIDVSSKSEGFWRNMPQVRAEQFHKDYVVLRCRDRSQMLNVSMSIDTSFAHAYAFRDGVLVDTNLWKDTE